MIDFSHPYEKDEGVRLQQKPRQWFLDDRPAPGIGSVLDHSSVRPVFEGDQSILDFGALIHKGIEWSLDPEFGYDAFKEKHPEAVGHVESGRKAIEFFKVMPGWVEIPVCNRRLWYCTAIDAIGQLEDAIAVINWKSGAEQPWHGIQSAGEHMAFTGDDWVDLEMKTVRVSVYLQPDGSFEFTRHTRIHSDQRDFRVFEAACEVSEWKQGHGYARPVAKFKAKKKDEPQVIAVESSLFQPQAEKAGGGGLFD